MLRKTFTWTILIILIISMVSLTAAEEATPVPTLISTLPSGGESLLDSEAEVTESVEQITLAQAIEIALEHNLTWLKTQKDLELQNLQMDITGESNDDLRKTAKDMTTAEANLAKTVLSYDNEIQFVSGLDFPNNVLNDQWATLMARDISASILNGIIRQITLVGAQNSPPSVLIGALTEAKTSISASYFQLRMGLNTTSTQTNAAVANMLGLSAERNLSMKQAMELIDLATENGEYLLELGDADASRGFEMMTEAAFYGLLQAQEMYAVQTKAFERATEQYRTAEQSFEQGLLANSDLQMVQLQLNSAKISQYGSEIDLEKARMDFCNALGTTFDCEYELVEPEWHLGEITLEEGLALAQTNRTDMITATQNREMAQLNWEYVEERHNANNIAVTESRIYLEGKELAYQLTWVTAETAIRQAYLDWQNANYAYDMLKMNVALVENQLQIAQVSYDIGYSAGQGSPLSNLLQAQEQLASMEQALTSAEFGRNLAWQNFLKEVNYQPVAEAVTP